MDFLKFGDELWRTDVNRLVPQQFTIANHVVYGCSQFVVKNVQIPGGLICPGLIKVLVDQLQEVPAPCLDSFEISPEGVRHLTFLQKHLAIT